ncbi:MAG TPA: tripartite tricarboxylate transporter substrate binding protein [Burkholderiaceae bacterium]|nr:tripartite tricarboxylate transporter substrate binding protein [Burkholderiaceae bacterium]
MRFVLPFAAALGLLWGPASLAQTYPAAPITLVVPFAAGSGTDAVARAVGQKLSERLKQPVLIDNKPGASAQLGAQFVAKAKPDGYTLFMTTNTSHSANPSLFQSLRYDPIKDFTPIARVGELPFALVVHPGVQARTMKELIDHARANPGKLSYATPNSTSLVASETIKRIAGIDMVGIPYKSSPQAMTDLIGGQVQVYVVDFGSGMSMLKTDKIRALGVTTADSSKILPGVPPIGKTVTGFDLTSWNGVFGPAGLPRPVVDRLNTELQAVLADKDVQDKLAMIGFEVWPTRTPEEFAKYVADQLANWTALIKQAGIKPE